MNKKLLKTLIPTILLAAVLIAAVGSFVIGGRNNKTNDPTAESRAADYSENTPAEAPSDPSDQETEPSGATEPGNSVSETETTETETETETESEPETVDPLSIRRIWVGDSRIVGLTETGLGDPETDIFIGKNGRYYIWFSNDALPVLRSYLDTGEQFEVIVQIGINDCANKQMRLLSYYGEDYAELINSLIEEYPNARFWFLSIGEVIGTYGGNTQWEVKMNDLNPLVAPFNEIMKTQCKANYLPIGELIKEQHRSYRDNVHYSDETNRWLYGYVLSEIAPPKVDPPKEPEKITFVYHDEDAQDGSQDIRFTVWQEESFEPLSLEDGRFIFEGLMYEMEGAGRYFDRLLEYAPKRGKVWKRPEEERMPYPNWHLEDLHDGSRPGIVTIYPNKEEKFGMAMGAQSLLQMFIREPSDSKTPNPFYWEKN